MFLFLYCRELQSQKGAFSEFLAQHIQEIEDDEGKFSLKSCYNPILILIFEIHVKLLLFYYAELKELEKVMQNEDMKTLFERQHSTLSTQAEKT